MVLLLRKLLFPFSFLYGAITTIRNWCYDLQWFSSYTPPVKTIAVGNLSVGGTGKTPQIEYLIRLLQSHYRVATLSRGYKRNTQGFLLASENATAKSLGDEPYQFFNKFPNIQVAVDANRKNGIEQLLQVRLAPEIILLDDAFQHRKVKAGFYILLTAYSDLYTDDCMLPVGNLRERRAGAHRAQCIIVTKCPPDLSNEKQQRIIKKIQPLATQKVYFTAIAYDDKLYAATTTLPLELIKNTPKVIVAGIAKPQPFFDYLKTDDDIIKEYPDHHDFTASEREYLQQLAQDKLLITTEKDYVRLKNYFPANQLFYLPIRTYFINNGADFDLQIQKYLDD